MRSFRILFPGCLAILTLLLLIGPRVRDDEQIARCVSNIDLPGPFGLSLNCDSPEFLDLAAHPEGLLEEGNYRQSRPGLILVAAVLSRLFTLLQALAEQVDVLSPAPDPDQDGGSAGTAGADEEIPDSRAIPAYFAFLALNLLMLTLAFHLFWRLSTDPVPPAPESAIAVFAIGLLLIFNDVVKAFLLSPHTQILNILVPVVCLRAVLDTWRNGTFDRPRAFAWAIGIGLGSTAYGSVILVLPCILVPAALRAWQRAAGPGSAVRFGLRAGLLCGIAVAPSFAWYLYVTTVTGSFYAAEIAEYDQLVWIVDTLEDGFAVFAAQFAANVRYFVQAAVLQAVPALAVLGAILLLAHRKGGGIGAVLRPIGPLAAAAGFVSALFILFWTVIGWPAERLAYAAVPPLVVVAGAAAVQLGQVTPRAVRLPLAYALLPLSLAFGAFTVIKDGPFS